MHTHAVLLHTVHMLKVFIGDFSCDNVFCVNLGGDYSSTLVRLPKPQNYIAYEHVSYYAVVLYLEL